jgi:hypothetical protein
VCVHRRTPEHTPLVFVLETDDKAAQRTPEPAEKPSKCVRGRERMPARVIDASMECLQACLSSAAADVIAVFLGFFCCFPAFPRLTTTCPFGAATCTTSGTRLTSSPTWV